MTVFLGENGGSLVAIVLLGVLNGSCGCELQSHNVTLANKSLLSLAELVVLVNQSVVNVQILSIANILVVVGNVGFEAIGIVTTTET